ncbi:hypothetical protein [Microtetraspora sp. NBRC 16547]|uniref:hypothetical protein n=1 Tax=Microtetraspora sp. NBRC 16547 TaxID=3030993 RepID=UPI0024A25159|nr:hypothetical protein Misp02_45410 [Microtetraspora sp. NBRC 16547]
MACIRTDASPNEVPHSRVGRPGGADNTRFRSPAWTAFPAWPSEIFAAAAIEIPLLRFITHAGRWALTRKLCRGRHAGEGSRADQGEPSLAAPHGGRALTSVNGAAVTQASTAIPGVALYVSLLRGVLDEDVRSPLAQSIDLWDQLTGACPFSWPAL